jgi:hypothetical protein
MRLAFSDSRSACVEFTAFSAYESAEEGRRDDRKCPDREEN